MNKFINRAYFLAFVYASILFISSQSFAETSMRTENLATQADAVLNPDWPSPVLDNEKFGLLLFDLLEYRFAGNQSSLDWDFESWRGTDKNRVWIKTEGSSGFSTSQRGQRGDADLQLLYGKLVTPFFDLQMGARLRQAWGSVQNASRFSAVIGLEGLSVYDFEIESALFVSDSGFVSARISASKDFLFSQRTIAQIRLETEGAAKRMPQIESGSGLNDLSLGLRVRYEIEREIAPYIGASWRNLYGETADLRQLAGGQTSELNAVAGFRLWY